MGTTVDQFRGLLLEEGSMESREKRRDDEADDIRGQRYQVRDKTKQKKEDGGREIGRTVRQPLE
jgi:hypothetical protein